MCIKCERKSQRIGIPKGKFGKIKFWAHRLINGGSVPLFTDRRLNIAIEAHVSRILCARSRNWKVTQ